METPERVLTKRRLCLSQICKRRILDVFTSYFANKQAHRIFLQLHPNKWLLRRAGVQQHSVGLSRAARWPLRKAAGRRGPLLPARYPHQTQKDPLVPHSSGSCTATRSGADPKHRDPGSRQKTHRNAPSRQPGGEATATFRPSPSRRGKPEPSARLTTGPAAPIPLPPFPHGTKPPRPPCSEQAGKTRQAARYLPGAFQTDSRRRRRRPQRDTPAAAARTPSGASMTAGPRRQGRPCSGGGAASPRPIRATPRAPRGGTAPPLEGAVRTQPAARGRRELRSGAGVCGGR